MGTPGEDVGTTTDAGSVTVARISADLELSGTVRTVDQNSAGMAGSVEAGDQLGAAVSSVRYGSSVAYLVGAPGEDVGRVRDAGMVQTIGNGKGWTPEQLGRARHAPRAVTASLADRRPRRLPRPTRRLIGIPGEDSSTGAVLVGLPISGGSVTYLKGTTAGNRFGFAVAPDQSGA